MIGLGPYIVQAQTPLGKVYLEQRRGHSAAQLEEERKALLERTTRMYALARLTLGNVNIAATTALQALDPHGRELALQRGANVVMPIITPKRLRGEGDGRGRERRVFCICFPFVQALWLKAFLFSVRSNDRACFWSRASCYKWSTHPIILPPLLPSLPQASTKSTKTNLALIKTLCRALLALTFVCSWREKSCCWMGNGTTRPII